MQSPILGGTKGIARALQSCRSWELGVPPSWAHGLCVEEHGVQWAPAQGSALEKGPSSSLT